MADPKIQQFLRPYSMEPPPLETNDLPRYLLQELRKLEDALLPLQQAYAPPVFVYLKDPTAPVSVTTDWQPIAQYPRAVTSTAFDTLAASYSKSAGTITAGSVANDIAAMEFNIDLDFDMSGMAQNNAIEFELYNNVSGFGQTIGYIWKADQQQAFASFSRNMIVTFDSEFEFVVRIKATVPFTIDWINGAFGFKYLNYARIDLP